VGQQGNDPVAGDPIDLCLGNLVGGTERDLSAGIPSFLYFQFAACAPLQWLMATFFWRSCGES